MGGKNVLGKQEMLQGLDSAEIFSQNLAQKGAPGAKADHLRKLGNTEMGG